MPELAQSHPTESRRRLARTPGGLGVAAIAATLVFTLNGFNHAGAAEYSELPPIQSVISLPDENAEIAAALAQRTGSAARSDLRVGAPSAMQLEVPELTPETPEAIADGEFLPVTVTPAPIWCSFTGLTHLPETDDLCTHPRNNTPDQNRALGEYLTAQRGWVGEQWQCMDSLMTRESRWRHNAANPVTAARGIPQKMMSVHYGASWRTSATAAAWMADPEAQIEWGLNYIQRRYQTPCGAWNFFLRHGWY